MACAEYSGELSQLRCLVLGGGGFIGTNLCRSLLEKAAVVRGFGRRVPFIDALQGVDWLNGDFSDPTSLANAVSGCDTVFHLITSTTPASANVDRIADLHLNVASTLKLLEICKAEGVRRIIFVSSGGTVYGRRVVVPTPEDSATDPITAYGIGKLAIEKYLALYEYIDGLDYRVLRVANPYGPFQLGTKNQGVINAFLKRALEGKEIEIWGDGSIVRDYVYVDDVVRALELAAVHRGEDRIFNIGSGQGHRLVELIELIQAALEIELRVRFSRGRAVDVPVSILDISRAQSSLNWQPEIFIKEGLEKTIQWMKSRGTVRN